ncbi:zinc-ribbon domain-containing protein, partial [Comamonas sp.]
MSLITCCPSCGTKFRVVADQLRISEGWVRCGRCQEVFDAAKSLEEVQ